MAKQLLLKSPGELEILRAAGKILAKIISELSCSLKSGMTTSQVNAIAEQLMSSYQVAPAFKGYRGYPASVCVSINQEVVHGIPGKKVIQDGDLVSLDAGIIYKNYFSDMAVTVGIGSLEPKQKKLLEVTREALSRGIAQARVNNRLSDISFAVQSWVESQGFSVVRDFVGHGIGRQLHEEPEIPNYGPPHCGPVLKEGMVLAIEPMVNIGTWEIKIMEDGWTVETLDGKPSAHVEHSIAITANGPEILTQ
jgi:methionyl aminopeptidase